jgi:hypothetical protein
MTLIPASRTLVLLGLLGAAGLLAACQTKGVGSACNADADCAQLPVSDAEKTVGIVPFCKRTSLDLTHTAGFTYPGGYCTKRCMLLAGACGESATCELGAGLLGEYDNLCLAACTSDTQGECRSGYTCVFLGSAVGACLPQLADGGIPELVDAGPGRVGAAGEACTADDACRPPSGGFCRQPVTADGGPSGYVGGECSAECGAQASRFSDGSWCGDAGACGGFFRASTDGRGPTIRWECARGCTVGSDAGCRDGYVCDVPGVCVPHCGNAGVACPTGSTCDVSGRCL